MFEPPAKKLVEELDSLGENKVRQMLLRGAFRQSNPLDEIVVREWLSEKDRKSRDAREEKTLLFASRANRIAFIAIVITVIFNAKEIRWLVNSFMAWLQSP